MKCPYCNNPDTRVIDSRPAEDGVLSDAAVHVMYAANVLRHMRK